MITSNNNIQKMAKRRKADDDMGDYPAVKSAIPSLDGRIWLFTGQSDRVVVKLDKEHPDVYIAAKYLPFEPGSKVLVLNGQKGYIALALAATNPDSSFEVLETNLGNAAIIERNLVANYVVRNLTLISDTSENVTYDAVVYSVSGYTALTVVEDNITIGGERLLKGGSFYLLGNMRNGVERHAAILSSQIGEGSILARGKGGFRIYEAALMKPITRSATHLQIQFQVLGHSFQVETTAGLFSKSDLDIGTRFLLESVPVTEYKRLLDAGCGWGAIGIVAATVQGEGTVVMTDIDMRATNCATQNVQRLGLQKRVQVVATNRLEELEGSFDMVLSNPPFHAETKDLTTLFVGIRDKLAKHGVFYFVVHGSYVEKLTEIGKGVFRQVTEHARNEAINFYVFKVRK